MTEDIADIELVEPPETAGLQSLVTELVVLLALFGIAQDLVGLAALLELLFGLRIALIAVGMVF